MAVCVDPYVPRVMGWMWLGVVRVPHFAPTPTVLQPEPGDFLELPTKVILLGRDVYPGGSIKVSAVHTCNRAGCGPFPATCVTHAHTSRLSVLARVGAVSSTLLPVRAP
jgi:hypothetical protein